MRASRIRLLPLQSHAQLLPQAHNAPATFPFLVLPQGLCTCKEGPSESCLSGSDVTGTLNFYPAAGKELWRQSRSWRGWVLVIICFFQDAGIVFCCFIFSLCLYIHESKGKESGGCLHRVRPNASVQIMICLTSSGMNNELLFEQLKLWQRENFALRTLTHLQFAQSIDWQKSLRDPFCRQTFLLGPVAYVGGSPRPQVR